ncbi:MFS transporter [Dickeya dadantii]|uniref:MFS transporter n=1 Tax=Dickeya dadantii TaxID=204038 RepID=UPI001CC725F6|nr:MFS transporter [Dickeya dadantii]UAY97308.1 MFS transporter [Dickeya dadantii]
MKKGYRNIILLFIGQGLTGSIVSLLTLTSTLAGKSLSPVPSLATLPVTATVCGSTLMVYFVSSLMSQYGRRTAFLIGGLIGLIGSVLAAIALYYRSFTLFTLSTLILGGATVFNQYYRFAAAEVSDNDARNKKATSLVIGSGVIGGFLGPFIAGHGIMMFDRYPYLGAFLIAAVIFLLVLATQNFINLPHTTPSPAMRTGAPGNAHYPAALRSPAFMTGTVSCAVGFAIMTLIMNSTPLAMSHHHFDIRASATVLQWHFFAMYAPALCLPLLMNILSTPVTIVIGALFFIAGTGTALINTDMTGYVLSLMLVGLGWSFMFSGGTFLINSIKEETLKHKLQGINSLATYSFNLIAALGAGLFMSGEGGWRVVNIVSLAIMAFFVLYLCLTSKFCPTNKPKGKAI